MLQQVRIFIWLTCLTGILYPLLITAIAQLTMKGQADGALLPSHDPSAERPFVGSLLIAQKFTNDRYFWPRPSAIDYNPLNSGGSNLGVTSKDLIKRVEERRQKLMQTDERKIDDHAIPTELLFASGSGLDPHITTIAAYFQLERIAKARGMPKEALHNLVDRWVTRSILHPWGTGYVNVLLLNQALDDLSSTSKSE